jgi:hypothetical protein
MTPIYRIILPHTELTAVLRSLLHTPGSIAICQAGLSQGNNGAELLAHSFRSTVVPAALPASAPDQPAVVIGLTPPGDKRLTPAALLDRYAAAGPIAGLTLVGHGRSTTIDACVRLRDGRIEPVQAVWIVGPGMAVLRPGDQGAPPAEAAPARSSRLTHALGHQVWDRLRGCCFTIVGCGRIGSQIAMTLACMGVGEIILVDPAVIEPHNLDAMDGIVATDIGRAKVDALGEALRRVSPALCAHTCAASITSLATLPLIKRSQFIISCTDDDGARWAAGVLATLYLKPYLDISTGIFDHAHTREMGADVRLILPGEGCVVCSGGLAQPGRVRAFRRSDTNEARVRSADAGRPERVRSLRSLNQIAAGIGSRLVEDLFAGRVSGSRWSKITFSAHGDPYLESYRPDVAANCYLCRLRGTGDDGLLQIPHLPSVIAMN